MSTIQQALQDVGYQPTIRPRDIRRAQEREDITQALQKFLDGVMAPLIKVRRIQIRQAGSHYKVRYEGQNDCCFVSDPKHAAKRLSVFERLR
jgi:hypothetical protein